MVIRTTMNKQKLMVDNIIAVVLIVILLLLALTFSLFLLMSLMVYPMASLIIYGIYGIYQGIFNKKMNYMKKVFNFILGIMYILFAIFILTLLFTAPRIPINYVIYFLSLPVFLIGIGGFLKGLMVDIYSPSLRILNMIIGVITIIITIYAVIYAEVSFVFHLFSLLIALVLNSILRSELYLSEYGLSLFSFPGAARNIKLVFILMDSFEIQNLEDYQF